MTGGHRDLMTVGAPRSALTRARQRLGLRLAAWDGTGLDAADTPANAVAPGVTQGGNSQLRLLSLKTRLRGAAFILRSRSPELVRQELFAFLTVYQSLCSLRAEAAQASGIDPDRISLTVTVRIARDHAASQTAVTMHSVAQTRRRAIRDVLGDLLPARRDR